MKTILFLALLVLAGVISINDAFAIKTISNDSTGGDCATIGTWGASTKTCTLSSDLTEGIVIGSNGITINGNGYTISGNNVDSGILVDTKTVITITNINIRNFDRGIKLDNAIDVKISKNNISNNAFAGIDTPNSNKISVMDNTIENNIYGIYGQGAFYDTISGNTISGNSEWGIEGVQATIINNSITNNGRAGTWTGGVSAIGDIIGNNISYNNAIGVKSDEKGHKITNNSITNNGDIGLIAYSAIVSKNIISNNKDGIGSSVVGGQFYENTISGNENGAIFGSGTFYNNNFINNIKQAKISVGGGATAVFSQLPPNGGNYWSDYSSDCTDTNFDNFCDNPYPFSSGSIHVQDNYVWKVKDGWLTKFTIPSSISRDAVDSSGTTYQFTASATSEGNSLSVTCNPTSGSIFPIGKTDVICTASNGIYGKFTVTVNPLKPVIIVNSPSNSPNTTIEGNNLDLKIMITGNVQNKISGKDSIKVTFKDPTGFVVYDTNLKLDSQGNFNNEFDNPLFVKNMRDSGKYSAKFVYDTIASEFNLNYKSSVYTPPISSTDTDSDGIPDSSDSCPTQSETINGYADSDGCPDIVPTSTKLKLPSEFKKTAQSWASGQITNHEFLQLVQIEINRGTMIIPDINTNSQPVSNTNEIPSWIKNNAGWWADGSIDDNSFAQGIQFLFKEKILPVKIESQTTNDTDSDGIPDSSDSCPTQRETFNGYQDTDGCPDTVPPPIDDLSDEIIITPVSGSGAPSCELIAEGCYIPKSASVAVGGKVIFSNTDTVAHTFTAGSASDGPSGIFDTGLVIAGSSYEWTATTAGEVPYYCMVHPWMEATIFVGSSPYPIPEPEPQPISLSVFTDSKVYDLGNTVSLDVKLDGITSSHDVGIDISDITGKTVISRSVSVSPNTTETIEFKIAENFKAGTYHIVATSSVDGKTIKASTQFVVKSQYNQFKITSVQSTDQQGNPAPLQAGELGFIKVQLESNKSISTLVTVNLFDSELTSIGIGSIKTTLSSGTSEIVLSFMIPNDVALGGADIYVNAFSDWPSSGGVPLTKEFAIQENIQ